MLQAYMQTAISALAAKTVRGIDVGDCNRSASIGVLNTFALRD